MNNKRKKKPSTPQDQANNPSPTTNTNAQADHKKKHRTQRGSKKQKPKKPRNWALLIINLLDANAGKAFSLKAIFRKLNADNNESKAQIVAALEQVLEAGQVQMNPEGLFLSNDDTGEIYEGVVDFVNPRFAFVLIEGRDEDLWVNAEDLKYALDGDRVRVLAYPARAGRRREGEVIEILQRARTEFVGRVELSERFAFVIADSRKMHLDIFVPNNALNGARQGDKVIVEIKEWHTDRSSPVGIVKQVLGKAGTHAAEMPAILAEYGLPTAFPPEVEAEAKKIRSKVTAAEAKKRRDLRSITTFTIDPEDAKDFDDALSIRRLENGNWEIGVHIADVTHYVRPGTAIEQEAQRRATSVYLVDRVVPMLPEKLSNDLCSLVPHEDRLTFSAIFELDDASQVQKVWFGRTIIHSDYRFSYEQAQQSIDTGEGELATELQTLNRLAKQLNRLRQRAGAINFETTEVKFKLDADGTPIGIYLKERKDSHKLIEEFMLLANQYVAEFVFSRKDAQGEPKTMVYRVHEEPVEEKLQNFAVFAKQFGYDIALKGRAMVNSINTLIEKSADTPQQTILQSLAIRTMAKARYTTSPIGHFGLAFAHYTHFTSPIRRYPDMMAHRLLQAYLNNEASANALEIEKLCKQSTDMEKRAADAERASVKYKQVEYMQNLVGKHGNDQVFDGVVTGVTEWGVFVEIVQTRCEGMVRLGDMTDDIYELDADNYRVVGKYTKHIITFGDSVRVRVKDTNLEKRTMDLVMVK